MTAGETTASCDPEQDEMQQRKKKGRMDGEGFMSIGALSSTWLPYEFINMSIPKPAVTSWNSLSKSYKSWNCNQKLSVSTENIWIGSNIQPTGNEQDHLCNTMPPIASRFTRLCHFSAWAPFFFHSFIKHTFRNSSFLTLSGESVSRGGLCRWQMATSQHRSL